MNYIITARKRSLGQGNMFTGMCLSTAGACMFLGCVCASWGCMLLGDACFPGRCMLPGEHAWLWGACMVAGGMCGCGEACMVVWGIHGCGGGCVVVWGIHGCGGACVVAERGPVWDTMRYGQWVGGTHPTGMHSCEINAAIRVFPYYSKLTKLAFCTTSNGNKLEMVTNGMNFTANLQLLRCFKLKLKWLTAISV